MTIDENTKVIGRFHTQASPRGLNIYNPLYKKIATGWDMFAYQGQVILEGILGQTIDFQTIKKHVSIGLSSAVK